MNDEELKAAVIRAGNDERGIALRRELCEALTLAFKKAGEALWLCGAVIGPDQVDGVSPFGFGSDATVGLATVVQIAGEQSAWDYILTAADKLDYGEEIRELSVAGALVAAEERRRDSDPP
jgi:hypothetical protein